MSVSLSALSSDHSTNNISNPTAKLTKNSTTMRKYYNNNTKKTKNTTNDVTFLTHGVRTRARTLALRSFDCSYLQLRSRCLVKKIHTPVSKQVKFQVEEKNHEVIKPCFVEITKERSTRESTPCHLVMAADDITPQGSTTKQTSPTQNAQNGLTAREMDEFFTQAENSQQLLFIQKYNFDVVHDKPLSGRYEWVKVTP